MAACERLDVIRVAPADYADERHVSPTGLGDHEAVAPPQALVGQPEPSELIVAMRVDARVVEHEIGLNRVEQARQMRAEHVEIGVVLDPSGRPTSRSPGILHAG